MSKPHQNVTHSKYYIYRHQGNNGNHGDIQYRANDTWSENFDSAKLITEYEDCIIHAESLKAINEEWYICVGKVHVVTDPYFPLQTV